MERIAVFKVPAIASSRPVLKSGTPLNEGFLWTRDEGIKNIHEKDNWSVSYQDTTKLVGQIRDMAFDENGNIKAASFNGYVLELKKNQWTTKQITKTPTAAQMLKTISNRKEEER